MVIYHAEVPVVVASIALFPKIRSKVVRSLLAKVECLLNVVIRCQIICDVNWVGGWVDNPAIKESKRSG
jgi:hypothetical protein